MYTEDEARGSECCDGFSGEYPHNKHCTASKCMAWRWRLIMPEVGSNIKSRSKLNQSTTHGYCGLAGKP